MGMEVFGVRNWAELGALDDETLLECIVDAWPEPTLTKYAQQDPDTWPSHVKATLQTFLDQYATPLNPAFPDNVLPNDQVKLNCPVFAIGCEGENAKGERPEKLGSLRWVTTGHFAT